MIHQELCRWADINFVYLGRFGENKTVFISFSKNDWKGRIVNELE